MSEQANCGPVSCLPGPGYRPRSEAVEVSRTGGGGTLVADELGQTGFNGDYGYRK